ncbi:MAG: EAL domain-containing protein [Deltaproteobacteria bacterium]|nr:EAL domain-containing protein [Deltaproteobacteria bacterium]
MRSAPTLLRRKGFDVGRRLLISFVVSALVPVAAAMSFAYWEVTNNLQAQSEQRLRQASKAIGLELLDRLLAIDWALARYASGGTLPVAEDGIAGLLEVGADGATRPLEGRPFTFAALSRSERQRLAVRGKLVRVTGSESPRIEVIRQTSADSSVSLVALVDPQRFFDVEDQGVLPREARVCVFEGTASLYCDGKASTMASMPERGSFRFERAGEEQFAHVYPLFLYAEFQNPGWTVLLSEPRAQALAAAEGFGRVFSLAGLLSLIFVFLISIRQIRARLEPLQELKRGTLRIAEQDFDVRVQLTSGDEFEEVAESFNLMAERLRHQFESLSTLIEIDRGILEATDGRGLLETVLRDLPRVCPCDAVTIVRMGPDRCTTVTAPVDESEEPQRSETENWPPPDHRQRLQRGESVDVDLQSDPAAYLAPLRELGMVCARLLPMQLRGELGGVVALAWREVSSTRADEDFVYARRVADQAAVALDSAHVHEENRTLAYFDTLTDLPNRLLFRERLDQAVLRARRTKTSIGVCLFDLDGFKRINDSLGHGAGDRLLQLVAARARKVLRDGQLARVGGDEFTVLFSDIADAQPVARAVERLLDQIAKPFDLDGREVCVTASVGIAVYPEDGDDPETLLKHADVAMYHAKEEGRNNYQFFSDAMTVAAVARLQLEQALRHALEAGELRLVYQPIVSTEPGRQIIGAEALMRWDHPELGTIPPTEFIPIAEEAGLIVSIGDWALREAADQARRWREAGTPISVSVNVSPRQFREEAFITKVRSAVIRSRINPGDLTLEITEGLLMSNEQSAVGKMAELKRMGLRLAIDDFGTGYSSFAYLKHFPVDSLKLDRCFVRDMETNSEDAAITRAIIQLGHSLGMGVVAEGVETEGQERLLVEAGCDRLQGFRYGRPGEPEAFDFGA